MGTLGVSDLARGTAGWRLATKKSRGRKCCKKFGIQHGAGDERVNNGLLKREVGIGESMAREEPRLFEEVA